MYILLLIVFNQRPESPYFFFNLLFLLKENEYYDELNYEFHTCDQYIHDYFHNFSGNLNVYKKEKFLKAFKILRLVSYLKS